MPTPSGTISLNDVNVELGLAGTTTISMNQTNVRTLAGVPSGAISMQNLQNKSNRVTASATIAANTSNYTLDTGKAPGYSSGKTDMTLTINSGVFVSSSSTGSYAFTVNTSWAAGDTVTIVNNGTILGRGGNGGINGNISPGPVGGGVGGSGGPALLVQRAVSINNVNRIAGGGGGGGGGACAYYPVSETFYGGGGGGGGIGGSSGGGTGYVDGPNGNPGGDGTLTSAGGGGAPGAPYGGAGGGGGGYGSSGSKGANAGYTGASGGAAGAAVVGDSNITWINTGTRNGSIS